MKKLIALAAVLFCAVAHAQDVVQSGQVTPNHVVKWVTNGIVGDGGASSTPTISSFGTLGPICSTGGSITSAYNQACIFATLNGGTTISSYTYGGATTPDITFDINGTKYTFPYTVGGIVGPASSTVGDAACWNNTGGSLLADCGFSPASSTYWPNAAMNGDCTLSGASAITCTKTNGALFTYFATGTDSSNLTGLGADMSASGGLHVGAFTGDVTKSAGSLATTVTAIQGLPWRSTTYSSGQIPTWNATNSRFEPGGPARTLLTGNVTYYWNCSTGNDSTGTGTSGNPWKTPAHVYNYVQQHLDLGGQYVVTAQGQNATCTDADSSVQNTMYGPIVGAQGPASFVFRGDTAFPSNVSMHSTVGSASIFYGTEGAQFTVEGIELGSTSGYSILAGQGAYIKANSNYYDKSLWSLDAAGARIWETGGSTYLFTSGANGWAIAESGAHVTTSGAMVLSGAPAWTIGWVTADIGSTIDMSGFTFTGSGTGPYWNVTLNGVIFTSGGGCTGGIIPGSTAGSSATGGVCQ